MRRLSSIITVLVLVLAGATAVSARDDARPGSRPMHAGTDVESAIYADPGLVGLYQEAAVDTYCIVWYDFEQMNWQGWTRQDWTSQPDTFFHVDDFFGIFPGDFGRLVPLEGAKSMWCGTRRLPGDWYTCSWEAPPGYGNSWNQSLSTGAMTFTGAVTLSYKLAYDSEPDCDYTYVEYDAGGGDWEVLASYSDIGSVRDEMFIPMTQHRTKLRFHFVSDGAWSDQDGLWNTDGACIIDSIRVVDAGGYVNYENFEGAPVGALGAGIWHASVEAGFGLYSGLRAYLYEKDPCGENLSTQIVFFLGSDPVPAPGYPGDYVTPFCKGGGGTEAPCQKEYVVSPPIDLARYSTSCNRNQNAAIPTGELPGLGGLLLRFAVYADLPLQNLVFYNWYIRGIDNGCPGQWNHDDFAYYAGGEYLFLTKDVARFIDFNQTDSVQIALGVQDMCDVWYLMMGDCSEHTRSPWYDNVRLYRYKTSGPQWSYRPMNLFQDNFPELEYDIESYVRADAANDIRPMSSSVIDPGDSIVVDCTSPLGNGIDTMPNGYPAVYLHVRCAYVGPTPAKPPLAGATLQGTYGLYVSDDGTWTIIQGDYARIRASVVRGKYMFDLNDSLFTRGYMIEYYFTARDNAGVESALPKYARSGEPYFEFTCLPTKMSDILFVMDYGRYYPPTYYYELEMYWSSVFGMVYLEGEPDRYDVLEAASAVSNGPGSRAKAQQLIENYNTIIWDSGDLQAATITDGTTNSDKSNDCQMLIDWIEGSDHDCGLWILGDNVAYDLTVNCGLSTPAHTLMHEWCGTTLVDDSYFDLTGGMSGGVTSPLVTGDSTGIFTHYYSGTWHPDHFYLYGGCPLINRFDCLGTTASGAYALDYPPHGETSCFAGIQAVNINPMARVIRTMWFGFSFMYIRDDDPGSTPIDRKEIAIDVLTWMQHFTWTGVDDPGPSAVYALAQNFPNPFNPVTTLRYSMREKGVVTLKIYNVAGQLVRTLVNEVKDVGAQTAVWDGRNNLGAEVASGIYFYQMETAGFSATRKMVLLR